MAFLGQDGFVWAIGVVEDRFDPEKQGRIRVRWLGYHTDEKARILTKDLPWAQVMQPVSNNSMSGVGDAPVNLVEGSWVVGFFRDPGTLQDPIVIGTMPGQNTTTALTGEGGKKWAKYRGAYTKYNQDQAWTDALGNKKVIEGSENEYKDYERGFFDPTVDQRKIPAPPSEMSWMNSMSGTAVTLPNAYILFDYEDPKLFPRIMNWSPEDMDLWDLDCDGAIIPKEFETGGPNSYARINHSDVLLDMFKTTRRVTSDIRWCTAWTDFGKFQWPDTMTYSKDYSEKPTNFVLGKGTKWEVAERKKGEDRDAVTFSTGYLETGYWRDQANSMPTWPWIRQMAAVSKDPSSLTGISPTDTRASWGQTSGDETGYWALSGESYRTTYPRVRYLQRGHLSPSQKDEIKRLFEHGHYGTGVYQLDAKEGERREDIKWDDVKNSDLVIVPTPDTNRLALGGIPIASFDGSALTTQSGFFTTADTSMGANARPLNLQSGDIVQIAGCRGLEECNGHVFRAISVGYSGGVFSITLGTVDGKPWSGPGGISWSGDSWSVSAGAVTAPTTAGDYVANTGVVLIDPHPVLQWQSDARERQINVGSPNAESGLSKVFWNQPTSTFAAQYPFNNVYESESGHIKEFDDTPGAERIHEYHRSGTYNEVNADGTKVDYVKGDNYDIRIHDDYMYVKGKVMHTFDDEVYIRYNDRADISAKYKLQIWSGGDLDIHSKRNINMKSDGDINFQADGHINFLGTTLTEAQSKEYKAGTRLCKEYSKIKMKAGHFQMEMTGDPLYTEEPAISLQSNQGHIQIKTLEELKSIFITSAEDIELFANRNQYRTAWEGNMWDYAHIDHNIMAATGNMHILASGTEHDATESGKGSIFITGKRWVDIEACKEDLNLTAGWKDINMKALCVSDPDILGGRINMQTVANTVAGSGVFSLTSDEDIEIKSTLGHINIEAIKDTDGWVSLKAAEDMFIQAADEVSIKSGTNMYHYAVNGVMNIKASGNILETGAEIHLNGPGAGSAADAATAAPIAADSATPALLSTPAYIAESFEIMVTDLPNPMFADPLRLPEDSHGIALTPNITGGFGGENIRDLQDLLSEMSSGMVGRIPVYPTENEGSAVGDMWIGNRTVKGESGDYTSGEGITDPWDGYQDQVEELDPLGKRSYSEERRFLGWTTSGDTPVAWNCLVDSTK